MSERIDEREALARALLRAHHAEVEPDPSFALRVSRRVAAERTSTLLGWAAMRVLPPAAALAAVLAGWCLTLPDLSSLAADGYLVWMLGGGP